jgi:hypothetical protein
MKSRKMEPLAIVDLDIEELERRLELAAATSEARSWCQGDTVCGGDCPSACVILVKT